MLGSTPPIVKNLLIINALMLLATFGLLSMGIDLGNLLGLHHWSSDLFNPIQFVTYIFMHGNFSHLLLNMFALWMFGRALEQVWGSKRFLIYFLVTGIGAGLIQLIVMSFSLNGIENEIVAFQNNPNPESLIAIINKNFGQHLPSHLRRELIPFLESWISTNGASELNAKAIEHSDSILNYFRDIGTVGASGSVFGILLAFGMLFPNTELMFIFLPIPIKAKYFVIGYGVIELYSGIMNNPEDNVAHFAHLGGMLFGFILIKYWKKNTTNFY